MATFTNREGTLLGPLTTAWAMPSDCMVQMLNCATCTEGFGGQSCHQGGDGIGSAQDYTGCWPPTTEGAGTPKHPFVGWGFYSPGLACPTGYTAACTARFDSRPEWEIEFNLREGETAVGCCPEGFGCTNRNGNTCILVASTEGESNSAVVIETGSCSGTDIDAMATATFPDLITKTVTETGGASVVETVLAMREITLLMPMIQLNYRASDLTASTAETLMTNDNGRVSTTTPSRPEETASGVGNEPSSAAMLGSMTGAIVGSTLGGLVVVGSAVWLLWWWKKRRRGALGRRELVGNISSRVAGVKYVNHHQAKLGTDSTWELLELDSQRSSRAPAELPTADACDQNSSDKRS